MFKESETKPQRSPPLSSPLSRSPTDEQRLALQRPVTESQLSWPVECATEDERNVEMQNVSSAVHIEQQGNQLTVVGSLGTTLGSYGNSASQGSYNEDSTAVWTHETILYLLEACESRKHLFHVPGVKKMDVWKQVAEELQALGLYYSWEACEKKMRNFRHRYKVIRGSGSSYAKRQKPWIYFDAVDSILSCDPSINQLTETVAMSNAESEFAVSWPDADCESDLFLECTNNVEDNQTVLEQHQLKLQENVAIISTLCDVNSSKTDFLTEDVSSYFIWPHGLIMKLISTCEERKHLFNTPGIMKKDVWKQIGHEMVKYNSNLSWEACEKKMRNLKHRYKLILNSGDKRFRDRKKWEYFEALRNLFANEPESPIRISENETDSLNTYVMSKQHTGTCVNPRDASQTTSIQSVAKFSNAALANKLMNSAKRLKTAARPMSSALSSPECPPWFKEFAMDQKRYMEDIIRINKEVLRLAKERNSILRTFTETILRQESQTDKKCS